MVKSRTLVSFIAELDKEFRNDHMKLCFLWYDEIMLEGIMNDYRRENYAYQILEGEKISKKQFQIFTDVVVPLQDRISGDLLQDHENRQNRGYPRWGKNRENFTYPDPVDSEQYAHNVLLSHIQREWGVEVIAGAGVEQAEGRAKIAIDAVSLWEAVRQEIPCIMEANYDERLAMVSASLFNSKAKEPVEPFKLFEASVPSLAGVPWSEIMKLKLRGNFDKLRAKLAELVSVAPSDFNKIQRELSETEKKTLDEIVEEFRPNVRKVAIESILSNVPVPVVNPASVFFGARDTIEEQRKLRHLSWFYLLRDVRDLVGNSVSISSDCISTK